jgi:hypothetical protein
MLTSAPSAAAAAAAFQGFPDFHVFVGLSGGKGKNGSHGKGTATVDQRYMQVGSQLAEPELILAACCLISRRIGWSCAARPLQQ